MIGKDLAGIEAAVAVGVFEDEDAISRLCLRHSPRVGVGLGDPEAASIVDRHCDRLNDVGLAGEEGYFEARRHGHCASCVFGAQSGVGVGIGRIGPPAWRHGWLGVVEAEVVEVDVAPAVAVGIDKPDHDVLAQVGRQVDHDTFQIFVIVAGGLEDDLTGIAADEARRRSWDASRPRPGSSQTAWRPGTGRRSASPGRRLRRSRTFRPRTGPGGGSACRCDAG